MRGQSRAFTGIHRSCGLCSIREQATVDKFLGTAYILARLKNIFL